MVSLPHSNVAGHGLAPTVTSAAVNGDGDDDNDDNNDVHNVDGGAGPPPHHSLQTESIFNIYNDPRKVTTFIEITFILSSYFQLLAVISKYV